MFIQPYMKTPGYVHQGPADVVFHLEDGTDLPCHAALISVYSGVLRDILRSTPASPPSPPAAASPGASNLYTTSEQEVRIVPVGTDSLCDWVNVLQQLYYCVRGERKMDWMSAISCVHLADKYDMPALAFIALGFVNVQYKAGHDKQVEGRKMDEWQWTQTAKRWDHAELMATLADRVAKSHPSIESEIIMNGMSNDSSVGAFPAVLTKKLLAALAKLQAANKAYKAAYSAASNNTAFNAWCAAVDL